MNRTRTGDGMNEMLASRNGWTFDPTREVWFAKVGADLWTEVKGALSDPPKFTPFSPKAMQSVRA
jgi:hypothetical protein